jgi:hypothetical protein
VAGSFDLGTAYLTTPGLFAEQIDLAKTGRPGGG